MSYEGGRDWLDAIVSDLDEVQNEYEEDQTEHAHLGRLRVVEPHPFHLHSPATANLRFGCYTKHPFQIQAILQCLVRHTNESIQHFA